MRLLSYLPLVALGVSPVVAWLPGEHKEIFSRDGQNLFNGSDTTKRWLQASGKIRGVNLGSMFVYEPWIAKAEWTAMCGSALSEFDCTVALGQSAANAAFAKHWSTFITQADIIQMASYGLNTIRIPVGYWMMESIVYSDSEHFPQGGLAYLTQLVGWASDQGFYIIIDLHGAPAAQVVDNPDTGQYASAIGFNQPWQYTRAENFLSWMTNIIHTTTQYRNVGMLEVLNEPTQSPSVTAPMMASYYPGAYNAIRAAETALGVTSNNYLHVQYMDELYYAGDPKAYITNTNFVAYDDHRYLKWDSSVTVSQAAYLQNVCDDNRASDGDTPKVVGEWSLSVPDSVQWTSAWDPSTQQAFYAQFFAANVLKYEANTNGWIFWTWKSTLGDYRWSYQDAVAAGVIPTNVANINWNACSGL